MIEIATPEDVPRLCELLAVLFTQEKEFVPNAALQAEGLLSIIGSPRVGMILISREGYKIVGMVSLLYTVSTFLGGRVALLEDVVVDPAWRGKGQGSALLQSAIEHARIVGCRRITLLTDEDNSKARSFYEGFGFTGSAMRPFRLQLTTDHKRST